MLLVKRIHNESKQRFTDHESLGELFRHTNAETIQHTLTERLWQIIVYVLSSLVEVLEIDNELFRENLITDNLRLETPTIYTTLMQAG